jgi:dimethylamine corrinoid protein
MELVIRKMNEKDWTQVSKIYLEGIETGAATLVKDIPAYADWDARQDPQLRLVAQDSETGIITGFITVQRGSPETDGQVSIYVANRCKWRGVGTLLMRALQQEWSRCGCTVLHSRIFEENAPSIGLHLKTGFHKIGFLFAEGDTRRIDVFEWSPVKQLFDDLADAVAGMEEDTAATLAQKIVSLGIDSWEAIDRGLVPGMERAGELFEKEEYFIPELLMCADAMNAAMGVLRPHIKKVRASRGRIVIGTISGDTHDIGKNIVSLTLESAGFDVMDLGRDVSARRFVDGAVEFEADIIAMSSLMTTTMENMAEVAKLLEKEKLRERFILLAGGRPLSRAFAKRIGADLYAKNAAEALRTVKKILKAKEAGLI